MIPKNLPPAIPQIERARESPVATITAPVRIGPSPVAICNAPLAQSSVASFNIDNSARLHVRQLKSEIGQKMDAMNEREAQIRDHIHERRAMATPSIPYISFGLQEYHAPACARQSGIDHEAEQARHEQEVTANAHDQLIKFATNFFTIKNSMAQKAVEADKSFVTDL